MENQADITSESQKPAPNPTLRIDAEANQLLEAVAKKVGLNKGQYASAAIKYFAKLNLDPSADVAQGLHVIGSKVSQEARAVRAQNVDIANCLVSLISGWEKSLYGYLQDQQDATLNYLEHIERNLLFQQASLESNLLAPLTEKVIRGGIEANLARVTSKSVLQKFRQMLKETVEEESVVEGNENRERDQRLTDELRFFVEANDKPVPLLTPKPTLTPVPAKAVAPAPTPSTTPPK